MNTVGPMATRRVDKLIRQGIEDACLGPKTFLENIKEADNVSLKRIGL